MKINSYFKGIILAVIGPLLWGISGTVTQFLFQQKNFSPGWLVNIRLLFSGVILISLGLFKRNPNVINILTNNKNFTKIG